MARNSGGWDPKSFEDVVAQLNAQTMQIALNVKRTRTCPAPWWDRERPYRVALVGDTPIIQRFVDDAWGSAPLEAPRGGTAAAKAERTTDTRLFISHSSEDAELAKALTEMIDGALTVPPRWIRCTSVVGYKLEPGADGPDELRANLNDSDVVIGLLTQSSLASAYVLMELGAAWGFKNWVVPLLAAGTDFKEIPGPIGQGVHGLKVSDEAAVAQLLETISNRCKMAGRAPADRRHELVKSFVAFATAYRGKHAASAATASSTSVRVVLHPGSSAKSTKTPDEARPVLRRTPRRKFRGTE